MAKKLESYKCERCDYIGDKDFQKDKCPACGDGHAIVYKCKECKSTRFHKMRCKTGYTQAIEHFKELDKVRYLNAAERRGFACNTLGCPSGADYGIICDDGNGVRDVRCEDCAKDLGWIIPEVKNG